MVCYTVNNRGRYKCDFCDHATYKTESGIRTHLQDRHELAMTKALLEENKAEVIRLRSQPPKVKVEVREKVVYRDPPAKPEAKQEFWNHGVYCSTCKIAYRSVGIPRGQTIENTPHSNCGTRSLLSVEEVVY